MNNLNRIIEVLLSLSLVLILSACSSNEDNKETDQIQDGIVSEDSGSQIQDGIVFEGSGSQEKTVELGIPDRELDPQSVYSQIAYVPEMFYGEYSLRGGDEAQEKFGAESQYFTWNRNGSEIEYTKIPFKIIAGKNTLHHSVSYIEGYNWMKAYYMRKYGENQCSLDTVICAYEIEGNKLILKPLDTFEVDKENNKITYTFTDEVWEYNFSFSGRTLTLSSGEESVALETCLDAYCKVDLFYAEGYLSPNSKSANDIDYIRLRYDSKDKDSSLSFALTDGTHSYNSIAVYQENGLFTFTLSLEENVNTYQYICFMGGYDGLVLTDGTETYYYNDSYSDRNKLDLSVYITEDQNEKLDELSESQLESIVEKKENLMEELSEAFNDAGITVTVDEKTGELAMDSSVLFGGDSSILTDDGKVFLNKFVDVYTSIVFSDKYDGFVSKTMIEGHTAPIPGSTYESGMPLSEERANNVKNYCVSSDTGVDTSMLAANLEAIGYSNSKPVYDTNGDVDMAASRRVSFRFIINIE